MLLEKAQNNNLFSIIPHVRYLGRMKCTKNQDHGCPSLRVREVAFDGRPSTQEQILKKSKSEKQ